MNLIKQLLSRRQKTENVESASSVSWPGQSGREYPYQAYPLDSSFQPIPANYIYAKQSESGYWVPLYIGQTRNLNQRLEEAEKQGLAMQEGATHILIHISDQGQAARCSEERDLILQWRPPCNDAIAG